MSQFIAFVRKECLHIFRDGRTMLILLVMPAVQLVIFGFAITTEVKNVSFAVLDNSQTVASRQIIEELKGSSYFNLYGNLYSFAEVEDGFRKGHIKLAVVIPSDFSNDLRRTGTAVLQLLADASDPNEALTITSYAGQVVAQYRQSLFEGENVSFDVRVETKMLYNPQLKSAYNFVPGLMGMILMLICAMMTSISIVREKEQGTMEVLLASPTKPLFVVLSKAVPYLLLAMFDAVSVLLISFFVLKVPVSGNILLILLLCMLFTLSALSLGILISSVVKSQQAAMLASGAGLLLPTMLLSDLVFPIENMPLVLQVVSNIVPAKWFVTAMKDLMIKGLGFSVVWDEMMILLGMTLLLLIVSVKRFKNRL